ncbi:hypothetical protein SAMN05661008_00314 [Alkalithermobacter thermoalcaliphilus JW-YL-7 = DSM 7308]|uniref:Uncharacterized protein n=1 Tax=Alkalithermobacter thermoalcaliphilus JW-YL-7 = DSM 7308 TaxID=1121328 RepID=A0A150FR28_CLOPD|nr:hypothetical protein JWYL7_0575 [[Clostridium] paradoxum JW-YL-7 = DSM 7308]SHK49388.1 hypothetical protein SAMN05661008_00314 [[Clostridium] paradoxum JW-YL-7 = DSM 7308]
MSILKFVFRKKREKNSLQSTKLYIVVEDKITKEIRVEERDLAYVAHRNNIGGWTYEEILKDGYIIFETLSKEELKNKLIGLSRKSLRVSA